MTFQRFDLTSKVALVTGGAGLLGKQHTEALLETGAFVYVADVNNDAARAFCDGLGGKAAPLHLNVADAENVKACLNTVLAEKGAIDILVNNAAIDPKVDAKSIVETSRLENFPLEQWQLQLNVGLTGAFLCSKHFGGWMASNNGGVILNIASDLSVFAPDQRLYRKDGLPEDQQPVKPVTYPVIKTALLGLTRYLATYWADKGIRVNALSPGGVYTSQPDEFVAKLSNLIPLGRMAKADEYRAAVQFLCSDASSYMTGQNIVMDGGRSVL
jgi:NAD(P)-dependent dehydrogenase (short-subunit alcohol dehydrogenase family)